ncbi:hypothetical protein SFC50_16120 [Bacillus infantis]|uniref:hypothetical protein n=1 Tax=Bacillus infantis TaxID=324767 RepID=UPI0039827731
MRVLIEIQLTIDGTGSVSTGDFTVNNQDFKKDPDFACAVIAYEWIQKLKYDTGFRETTIDEVTWNQENDITELVKTIKPIIADDNLPF